MELKDREGNTQENYIWNNFVEIKRGGVKHIPSSTLNPNFNPTNIQKQIEKNNISKIAKKCSCFKDKVVQLLQNKNSFMKDL